jgi:hypothetical protein
MIGAMLEVFLREIKPAIAYLLDTALIPVDKNTG